MQKGIYSGCFVGMFPFFLCQSLLHLLCSYSLNIIRLRVLESLSCLTISCLAILGLPLGLPCHLYIAPSHLILSWLIDLICHCLLCLALICLDPLAQLDHNRLNHNLTTT
jgi:hypothetical protein